MKSLYKIFQQLWRRLPEATPTQSVGLESKPPESTVGEILPSASSTPSEVTKSKRIASICYSVDEEMEFSIDIEIEDYSEETVENFSLLFASIPSTTFQVQAMQILQAAFERAEEGKAFEDFARAVIIKTALVEGMDNFTKEKNRRAGDQPVVSPTDLI